MLQNSLLLLSFILSLGIADSLRIWDFGEDKSNSEMEKFRLEIISDLKNL